MAVAREAHVATAERFVHRPYWPAEKQALDWAKTRPADAALMRDLAAVPRVIWLGDFSGDYKKVLRAALVAATEQRALPVFAIYNVPNRDAGGFAAGGNDSAASYLAFIRTIAETIGDRPAAVIYEPDAVAQQHELEERARQQRYALFEKALTILGASDSIDVYVDAGNSNWHAP
jgi:endoglucanase